MNIISKWKPETVYGVGLYVVHHNDNWLFNLHGEEIGFNKKEDADKFIEEEKESLIEYFGAFI